MVEKYTELLTLDNTPLSIDELETHFKNQFNIEDIILAYTASLEKLAELEKNISELSEEKGEIKSEISGFLKIIAGNIINTTPDLSPYATKEETGELKQELSQAVKAFASALKSNIDENDEISKKSLKDIKEIFNSDLKALRVKISDISKSFDKKINNTDVNFKSLIQGLKTELNDIINSYQDISSIVNEIKNRPEPEKEEKLDEKALQKKIIDAVNVLLKKNKEEWKKVGLLALAGTSGGGTALVIKDEGSNITTAASSIDFVGSGVSATAVGNAVTVTISSGGQSFTSVAKTADFSVAHADSFKRFHTTGATGTIIATFDIDIQADDEFIFCLQVNQILRLQLATGQTLIIDPNAITSSAGTAEANKKGALIHIWAVTATQFQTQTIRGTWSKT